MSEQRPARKGRTAHAHKGKCPDMDGVYPDAVNEIEDNMKEARKLTEVFSTIAGILESLLRGEMPL